MAVHQYSTPAWLLGTLNDMLHMLQGQGIYRQAGYVNTDGVSTPEKLAWGKCQAESSMLKRYPLKEHLPAAKECCASADMDEC